MGDRGDWRRIIEFLVDDTIPPAPPLWWWLWGRPCPAPQPRRRRRGTRVRQIPEVGGAGEEVGRFAGVLPEDACRKIGLAPCAIKYVAGGVRLNAAVGAAVVG